MHKWSFSSIVQGANVLVVAVCGACGLVRVQTAPGSSGERHIDLGGNCPGKPQEPESPPEPFVAAI